LFSFTTNGNIDLHSVVTEIADQKLDRYDNGRILAIFTG